MTLPETDWWKCTIGFAATLKTRKRVDDAAASAGLSRATWLRQAALEKLAREATPSIVPESEKENA